jgi:hypothetical protein
MARLAALVGVSATAAVVAGVWLSRGPDAELGDVGLVGIRDVLIARDAQVHEGSLEGCTASSCRLDGHSFERSAVAFIGLGVEEPTPPPVEDPRRDEVYLREGGVLHEPLAQIDDDAVFAGARRLERGEVAWVYLATAPPPPEGGGVAPGEPEQPPPPPQPEPDSSTTSTRRPHPDEPFEGCPDDRPLGAWIWLRNDYQDIRPAHCRGTETQVVRFRLEPVVGSQLPGSPVALAYGATELRYSVSTDGCFDAPDGDPYSTCNADGAFAEGTLSLSPENLGVATFFPLEPQLSFQYPTPPVFPLQLTVRCLHGSGTRSEHSATGFNGITLSPGDCGHPHRPCNDYCAAPTECKELATAPQDCYTQPERYAVIPFEGSLVDGPGRDQRGLCSLDGSSQVRWRVCCGCAETGPPPDFGRRDPCGPPDPQRALLDTALEQQRAILQPLGELLREQQRIQEESKQWQNDFEQATRDCRLWSAARTLVGLFASGAPGVGTGVFREAGEVAQTKQFWNFLAMAEKVHAGDPSWLLPNHEFGDWVSVEDAWDGFMIGYGALGPSSPESLREGLQQCGAPTVEGVLDGAYEYLRLLEQLPALGERMHEILNDSRAKDQEIFDLWQKWQQACREHERCRGGDPSRCDEPPQSNVSEGGAS